VSRPAFAPKRVIASIALLGAIIYAALAGFSVPTQRALFMLIGLWVGLILGRNNSMPYLMSIALALVLTLDPFAVLAAGFWLSFGLVAALFAFLSPQLVPSKGLKAFIQSQWIATLVSIIPLLYFFGQLPLVSPVANAISIPLVSTLITPLALLGLLDPTGYLLPIAAWLAKFLFIVLDTLAQVPVVTQVKFPIPLLLIALLGSLLLAFPRGTHLKISGLLCFLPLFLFKPERPQEGVAWVRVLDVGQGLAVLIETKNHTLLFDTGAQTANQVLLPQLQSLGYRSLDALVLSHHDNDHDGAAESLLAQLPIQRIYAGQAKEYPTLTNTLPIQHCHQQIQWQWDSVNFRFLTPQLDMQLTNTDDNAHSCVLRIQTDNAAALLTGDLPAQQERALLTEVVSAEVLILGHHGSKTSSSLDFLRAVNPKIAVVSAGYLNRYHHPHPTVLQRLTQENVPLWRTDQAGQILLKLNKEINIETASQNSKRYWRP
ncbi:MAG: DNA internalization-related competence protein ComEC/Rec2, partial [Neisseriaceae bacterium]|nr:DNA internalization-related competence protein ComEC/Rec2 [Neisseriaceae bacterium]